MIEFDGFCRLETFSSTTYGFQRIIVRALIEVRGFRTEGLWALGFGFGTSEFTL